jgi:hypothetical protein
MRYLVRGSCALIAVLAVAASASGAGKVAPVRAGTGPLVTGFAHTSLGSDGSDATQFERMRAAGATFVRITVTWSAIAPSGSTKPEGFQASDPADPLYNWVSSDAIVKAITDAGLEPIVELQSAPIWAQGTDSTRPGAPGGFRPSPAAYREFTTAIAERYSGSFSDLPRVRYWSIWNEPNLIAFLRPQLVKGKIYAPTMYRSLLNAAADAIHSVNSDNVVIAGETSPYGAPAYKRTRPLTFLEKVVCVSEKKVRGKWTYKSSCSAKAKFDVWAHHPYTEGGPTRKGRLRGNVSLGDLGDMRKVLNTGIRAKHVVSSKKVRLWVTEFSWDSKPPDPQGVRTQLHARWVSHAIYQAWSSGVTLFNWFLLRDMPYSSSYYQSGLYYNSSDGVDYDKPKPALRAFRFPFVALSQPGNKVQLWGRTPTSESGSVLIQRKSGGAWKLVKRLNANGYGIFKAKIAKPAKTRYLRARLADGSDTSVSFSLKTPKAWTGCVFGSKAGKKCTKQKG